MGKWWRRRSDATGTRPVSILEQSVALHEGVAYASNAVTTTETVELGGIDVRSGAVAIGDVAWGDIEPMLRVAVPRGRHRVVLTRFDDVWPDGSHHWVNAAASLLIDGAERGDRAVLRDASGQAEDASGTHVIGIDRGVCVFADVADVERLMADEGAYDRFAYDDMARSAHDVVMEIPTGGSMAVAGAGLGDGAYAVFGEYDGAGRLAAIHVNFGILTRDDLSGIG